MGQHQLLQWGTIKIVSFYCRLDCRWYEDLLFLIHNSDIKLEIGAARCVGVIGAGELDGIGVFPGENLTKLWRFVAVFLVRERQRHEQFDFFKEEGQTVGTVEVCAVTWQIRYCMTRVLHVDPFTKMGFFWVFLKFISRPEWPKIVVGLFLKKKNF